MINSEKQIIVQYRYRRIFYEQSVYGSRIEYVSEQTTYKIINCTGVRKQFVLKKLYIFILLSMLSLKQIVFFSKNVNVKKKNNIFSLFSLGRSVHIFHRLQYY